jgi:hypothetical protein
MSSTISCEMHRAAEKAGSVMLAIEAGCMQRWGRPHLAVKRRYVRLDLSDRRHNPCLPCGANVVAAVLEGKPDSLSTVTPESLYTSRAWCGDSRTRKKLRMNLTRCFVCFKQRM